MGFNKIMEDRDRKAMQELEDVVQKEEQKILEASLNTAVDEAINEELAEELAKTIGEAMAAEFINTIESDKNDDDVVLTNNISYTLEDIVQMVTSIMNFNGKVNWFDEYDDIKNKDVDSFNDRVINLNKTPVYDALEETIGWYLEK